jgi:hypothetical protein
VGQLEVLLVFFNNPDKTWSPYSLSLELRTNETSAAKQMAKFASTGFIKNVSGDLYSYDPSPDMKEKIEHLHLAYKEMSVAVISFIYEKPSDKLRGFADAFKIKKD